MVCFFFFNDTATTEIYTLSLHDALPISARAHGHERDRRHRLHRLVLPRGLPRRLLLRRLLLPAGLHAALRDRKSTRLNSSHANISYAVFCLKKKKKEINNSSRYTQ